MARPLSFSRLWRSTPIRQALLLVAIFSVIELLTLGGAYLKLRSDLIATLEREINNEIASLDISATPRALATLVTIRARVFDPQETVMVYLAQDGSQSGNAQVVINGDQIRLLPREDETLSQAGYMNEVTRLSSGVLIVAKSLAPLDDLVDMMLALLALSLLPTMALSFGLATIVARHAARRVERIETTLDQLSAGHLDARVGSDAMGQDDLSRIAGEVDRMASRQESAHDALRQVTSDIAHDLRTPMQRISVLLQDLSGKLPDDGEAAELADKATIEAERALSVFSSMLQIAQIEGTGKGYDLTSQNLGEIVAQIHELYLPTVEDAGGTLGLTLPETPVLAKINRDLVSQALANLIENALRHSGERPAIEITLAETSEEIRLTVADRGPGIPKEEREAVTRRLYRLERSRSTPGHGLGLSLVKAVAEHHGGHLELGDHNPGLSACLVLPRTGLRNEPSTKS